VPDYANVLFKVVAIFGVTNRVPETTVALKSLNHLPEISIFATVWKIVLFALLPRFLC